MPTYRFMCPKCSLSCEVSHVPITADEDHPAWPECQCGVKMQKVWINPEGGFVLKGGGWEKKGGY